MANIDIELFEKVAETQAADFAAARPFAHVVIDHLLDAEVAILESFPDASWVGWGALGESYQTGKMTCNDIDAIPEPFAHLIQQMSTPRFLRALEQLSGIKKLLPDPYLVGGGLHCSGPGGVLAPHTDFHIYDPCDLYRRINIIVYLCPEWSEGDGGCLEMTTAKMDERKVVVPAWGNAVVFRTDDDSIHGFPVPVAAGKMRRSIALYYYTAAEASNFSGDATTHWRTHGDRNGAVRKARLAAYRGLLQMSRAFSVAAHLVNPNAGLGWWRTRKSRLAKKG